MNRNDEINHAMLQVKTAARRGDYEEALKFIKELVSCYPFWGRLHQIEGAVHLRLALNADQDFDATVKNLEDAVCSYNLAAELVPNPFDCALTHARLVRHLALYDLDWDRVIESCYRALKISFSERKLLVGDVLIHLNKSRDDEERTIMLWVYAAKRALKVKIKEDNGLDINQVITAMDETKKQLKEIMRYCSGLKPKFSSDSKKLLKVTDEDISRNVCFWDSKLSDEKERRFRRVNIEELENHFKSVKYQQAVDTLWEVNNFVKQHNTWKFWECCACAKKFGDYELYRDHFRGVHFKILERLLKSSKEIGKPWIDMNADGEWKPMDKNAVINPIVNQRKSKKGLDESESSSVEEVPGETSKSDDNESSKTSVDDIERAEILLRIRGMFDLLLKNKCLAVSQVNCVIKYTNDYFESGIPLSKCRNLRLKKLGTICLLGASQLTQVLNFLKAVARTCDLSENVNMDDSMDGKLRGDQVFGFEESVYFSQDFSSLLLDEQVFGSSVTFAADKCPDDVLPDSDNVVSRIHMGSTCEGDFVSWMRLRHFQRKQAVEFTRKLSEEIKDLVRFFIRDGEILRKIKVIKEVDSMIHKEIKKWEKGPKHEQLFIAIMAKWHEKLQKINDISTRREFNVISKLLSEAQKDLYKIQSISEESCLNKDLKRQECLEKADNRIKTALRRLELQLTKDVGLPITVN